MINIDLDDQFDQFMRKVNPSVEQHSVQYRECRRVFYAGATVILFHLTALAAEPEAVGVVELERLHTQVREFKKRVKDERD